MRRLASIVVQDLIEGKPLVAIVRGPKLKATDADMAEAAAALEKFFAARGTTEFMHRYEWTLERISGDTSLVDGKRFDFEYLPKGGRRMTEPRWPGSEYTRTYKAFRASKRADPGEHEDAAMVYRGMSMAEWAEAKRSGQLQSKGDYNLGQWQDGWTFFGNKFRTAKHYATGFAPYDRTPGRAKPAVIVAVPKSLTVRASDAAAGTDDEYVAKTIPLSQVAHVWIATPATEGVGHLEVAVKKDWRTGEERVTDGSRATPHQTTELIKVK